MFTFSVRTVNDKHAKTYKPWHDEQVIAQACAVTRTNQEKGGLGGWWKAYLKVKLCELMLPTPNAK